MDGGFLPGVLRRRRELEEDLFQAQADGVQLIQIPSVFDDGSRQFGPDVPAFQAFDSVEQQAIAMLFLKLHGQGYNASLLFFGVYCVLLGYLIFRSTFLPRTVGVLMAIAGLSLLTNSVAVFIAPAFANALPDAIGYVDLLGEASLMLWLIVVGVNVPRWEERAKISSAA